jgi:N-sulfoglucosamine sulfohydrolase
MALGMQDLWRQLDLGNLDEVQMQWFSERPREMLFDSLNDPHEINNLAENPDYWEELDRMRAALTNHEADIYDYSTEMTETEMAELFWPGGEKPTTALPTFSTDQEVPPYYPDTQPIRNDIARQLQSKAVRYGWAPSEISELSP